MSDPKREMLRHTLATLAYRGGKAVRNAPPAFGTFSAGPGARTPVAILAHIGDLLDWSLGLCEGVHRWHTSDPLAWDAEVARFFVALERVDQRLISPAPLGCSEEQLFQGPIADALTHVGQLAMLRRLANAPIRAENYFRAEIATGRVGAEQSDIRAEFD
ncbi:MAG TPA: hypothetical protein VGM77_02780 [Gemmatimonadales bacterium]|jgi:hypothetical protein